MSLNINKSVVEILLDQKLNLMTYEESSHDDSELVVVIEYKATNSDSLH